jgi:hypothetical protein
MASPTAERPATIESRQPGPSETWMNPCFLEFPLAVATETVPKHRVKTIKTERTAGL